VCIYTHWGADKLVDDVKRAIAKRWRWDDPEYFTRIVADEVIKVHGDELGYGIGNQIHGDIWRLIDIDLDRTSSGKAFNNVRVEDFGKTKFNGTFEQFLLGKGATKADCMDMTVSQLRNLCRSKGVKGYSRMRKLDLIDNCCL
jgi:hypothetical protein